MAFVFPLEMLSQTPGLGTWNVLNVEINFNDKWGAFYEGQLRSQKLYNHFFYHETKGGFSYSVAPKTSLLIGTGQFATYNFDGNFESPVLHETRLWEQLTLTNEIGRFKLEHRYRIEQRFFTNGDYRNRFRYRLNALLPLNKEKIEKGAAYLNVFEEIFLTNTSPFFERSRTTAGIGYAFNNTLTMQLSYVYQYDFRRNLTTFNKHFLQTTVLIDINRSKTGMPRYPRIMD